MKLSLVFVACLLTPLLTAAEPCLCTSAQLTEESYTWDFSAEAASRIVQLQADVGRVQDGVDLLLFYALRPGDISRQTYFENIDEALRRTAAIADNSCRLAMVRRMLAPEQQEIVDRLRPIVVALVESAGELRELITEDRLARYEPEFRARLNELSNWASQLSESLGMDGETYKSASRLSYR